MKRYLLDTGPAANYVYRRGTVRSRVQQANSQGHRVGTCFPVAAELFFGAENSHSRAKNLPRVERALKDFFLWPFDLDAAREFGRIFAHLRRVGRPMQQIDVQIAAIVLALGHCTLVTADSDFAAIPGLDIEDWS